MSDAQIGLLLMFGATVGAGALVGFKHVNETNPYKRNVSVPTWLYANLIFLYYLGALMLGPSVMKEDSSISVYAVITYVIGIVVTRIASWAWSFIFKKFNQFVKRYAKMLPE